MPVNAGYAMSVAFLLVATTAFAGRPSPPPDLSKVAGTPASSHGKLYADCLAQAASAGALDQTSNKDTHLLRFNCGGAPAKALYDALATWSAAQHSEWSADGRTWRSTEKIVHDLFGTDYCSTDGAADYQCELTVNVGAFLDG